MKALGQIYFYEDHRRWGDWSFLDLLERNNIPYSFDGAILRFPNEKAYQQATSIWYNLSGSKLIGTYAKGAEQ